MQIPFNRPFIAGKELFYIAQAVTLGNLGGDGFFTKSCARLMEEKFKADRVLLTPSCTASLEMAAELCDLSPGDEVILPSYTFVSTAAAFVRKGARPVFVDIRPDTLNIDETKIADSITERTKAICVVHYAGVACEMDPIMKLAAAHKIKVVEDAAQAVNSYYNGRALGTIGDLGCYSFHETKNFICGEGGALCINSPELVERAEIIRDKGTNRQRFFRGEVDKYTWVDIGSSYVPSEVCSAFLLAQLEEMDRISARRKQIYDRYISGLAPFVADGRLQLPHIPVHCQSNYHLVFAILPTAAARNDLLTYLKSKGIHAVFHYVPLHTSPVGRTYCGELSLPITEDLSERLVRLPMFHDLDESSQETVIAAVYQFLQGDRS